MTRGATARSRWRPLAQAPDPSAPKTRERVGAELLQAQPSGDLLAYGNAGKKLKERYPSRYPDGESMR